MCLTRRSCFLALTAAFASLPFSVEAQDYYLKTGVPDYDQRRDALPGDGSMYCVPTSYADLLKYMALNGMPKQDLDYSGTYSGVSSFIAKLGSEMGTSSSGGTNSFTAWEKARDWIWANDGGKLVIQCFYGPEANWGTGTMRNALRVGGACKIGYGRYQWLNSKWDRQGGHAISLVGYDYRNTTKKIIVRDPASDDGDIDAQGSYAYDSKTVKNQTYTTAEYGTVTHARYNLSWSGDNNDWRALVDTLHIVLPLYYGWSYSTDSNGNAVAGNGLTIGVRTPWQFRNQVGVAPDKAEWSTLEPVADWCFAPGEFAAYVLFGDGSVRFVDLLDHTEQKIAFLPGAKKMVVAGPSAHLFFLGSGEKSDWVARYDTRLRRTNTVDLPFRALGIDADPRLNGVAVMPNAMDRVVAFNPTLTLSRTDLIPKLYGGTDLRIGMLFSMHHATGEVLMARRGNKVIDRIFRNGRTPAHDRQELPLLVGIESINPTEKGLIAVQDGGVLQTYDAKGQPVDTQLSGQFGDGSVRIPRTQQFALREHFRDPGWVDVLPEGKNP